MFVKRIVYRKGTKDAEEIMKKEKFFFGRTCILRVLFYSLGSVYAGSGLSAEAL